MPASQFIFLNFVLIFCLFCLFLTVQWRWFLMAHNATLTVDSWEIVLPTPTLRLLLLICNATVFVYFKIV